MDHQGNGQPPGMGIVTSSGAAMAYGAPSYQSNQMTVSIPAASPGAIQSPNHSLPLARIKKIMKADEDVRMISAEAPVVFARACEMFILELTLRAWNHTEENKRRTLQKNDIAAAITRTDIFDFLVDIVPREDLKDEVLASIPRGTLPVGGPTDVPYYYMAPQSASQVGASGGMYMGKPVDQTLYGQQPRPYMAQTMWPQQQQQPPSDS
nr:nuclear transcription factor Y subunit C-9-like isoform X1 [Ipomoea batatas]GMD79571.1 nuclear transcription factor Y subunit C-9-like isoform X1 [Ipomoea batatas]